MGYYSDVMFAFYPAGETETSEVVSWIEQHWPQAWCTILPDDDIVTVKYDDVKWYDDADYVQAAWAVVREFEEAFSTEKWQPRFRRTGRWCGLVRTTMTQSAAVRCTVSTA
jgi:hypothetical protein